MRKALLFGLMLLLTSCTTALKDVAIQPSPREISSFDEISDELLAQPIYWKNSFVYLSGETVEYGLFTFLEEKGTRGIVPKLSHNQKYLAYVHGGFSKISLWDVEANEPRELINTSTDLSNNATIGGITFTPDNNQILFSYNWHGNNGETYAGLAMIDIITKKVIELDIAKFQVAFHNLDISFDGEWAATNMVTLDNQVCLLINLKRQETECLTYEKGWYLSTRFTPNSDYVVYSHTKEIDPPSSIMISKIDGTENKVLVSGLVRSASIRLVTNNEIVFVGTAYDNLRCSHVYVINQDGSDLRKLSYLGEDCLTDKE